MPHPLILGDFQLYWLNGGSFRLDGGTMFGAVPKVLWQKKYTADAANSIPLVNDLLLVKTPQHTLVIDTGLGNKLTAKQLSIFQVTSPWSVVTDLTDLGLSRDDIDLVLLTHCDFDHAGGIVMLNEEKKEELTFPRALHYVQKAEWEDVETPCHRAQSTYWAENFDLLKREGQLKIIEGDLEVGPGIRLRHTGGHTRGHQLVELSSQGKTAVHLGDLFPTHAHINPLWIMAYDNFPLQVIERKKEYFNHYGKLNSWFTFYHDPQIKACKITEQGDIKATWPPSLQR
ncbi:MAG: MBL fold metallo-hydrolase [Proteobacteria bacterium]|nr:MBL fold metallo-hydrolase [Pseudomonadota bacterium]MBU1059781.1 MBL fold metallo-hydrolase [Pseudomonadota bacterium]